MDLKCKSNQKDDDSAPPSQILPPSLPLPLSVCLFLCNLTLKLSFHVNYVTSTLLFFSQPANQRVKRKMQSLKKERRDTNTGLRYGRYNENHYNGSAFYHDSFSLSLCLYFSLYPIFFFSLPSLPSYLFFWASIFHEGISQLHSPSHHHLCIHEKFPSPIISTGPFSSLSFCVSLIPPFRLLRFSLPWYIQFSSLVYPIPFPMIIMVANYKVRPESEEESESVATCKPRAASAPFITFILLSSSSLLSSLSHSLFFSDLV